MKADTKELLAVVGAQMDRLTFPVVKNGGFVLPRDAAISLNLLGKENSYELKRTSGSAAQSWTCAGRREGATSGPWSPGTSASLVGPYQGKGFFEEAEAVGIAYPGTQVWEDEKGDGFWLYTESHLLPGLQRAAVFLVGVSCAEQCVRAWAFWSAGVAGASWIGPRHTNFPDGSICAFEPSDGTWMFGQSLVTLLDLYSVWALRHLHLEQVGRWPGPQSVHFPYERILEVAADEHCPCGYSKRHYSECCQSNDLAGNRLAQAVNLVCISGVSLRSPPAAIREFILNRRTIPRIAEMV